MFFLKRYTIRSFEMGLHFRDGEFRGILEAGRHWFLDPLRHVHVEKASLRAPWLSGPRRGEPNWSPSQEGKAACSGIARR